MNARRLSRARVLPTDAERSSGELRARSSRHNTMNLRALIGLRICAGADIAKIVDNLTMMIAHA
jgi:hypothetical protein